MFIPHRVIDGVVLGKRDLGVPSVYRRGGGEQDAGNGAIPRKGKDARSARDVDIGVSCGIGHRRANARFCGQVDERVRGEAVPPPEKRGLVPDVALGEREPRVGRKGGQVGFLEGSVVEGIEVVKPGDAIAAEKEGLRHV
jgi:hypothetical protein